MMSLLINKQTILRNPSALAFCRRAVKSDLSFLAATYPRFETWFESKVVPGLVCGDRTIQIEQRDNRVIGLLILKRSALERKLCTLRVREEFSNRGLGIRLFESAFELLQTREPLLSVSDANILKFQRIFTYFGFRIAAEYRGLYRPNSSEFSFNGLLHTSHPPMFSSPGNRENEQFITNAARDNIETT